jgi:hypothetical protein
VKAYTAWLEPCPTWISQIGLDSFGRQHGLMVGARAAANLWFEPSPATMIAADAPLSLITTSYSARVAFGWRLRD